MFIVKHKLCIFTKLHTFGVIMYGKKLKEIRKQLAVTQEKMANFLGVSPRTYVSYERDENNPPYNMLVKLCIEYKINLNWFIADFGEMFNPPEYEDIKEEVLNEVDKVLIKYGIKK